MTEYSKLTINNIKTGLKINREISNGLSGLSYLEGLGTSVTEHYSYVSNPSKEIKFTYNGMNLSIFSMLELNQESGVILLNIRKREYPPLDKESLLKYILDLLEKEEIEYLMEIRELENLDIDIKIRDIIYNNVIAFIIFPSGKSLLIACPTYEIFYNFLLGVQDFYTIISLNELPRIILY